MEIWKDIKDYEGIYQVSDLGRVKSLERVVRNSDKGSRVVKERILKNAFTPNGYAFVVLSKESKVKGFFVHKLVVVTFLNYIANTRKTVIDHKNNCKEDNRLENLQIISNRENTSKDKNLEKKSSKYTGVVWRAKKNKWEAQININGIGIYLGLFKNELDAHNAYQKKITEIV
jgi:hypothetical protein